MGDNHKTYLGSRAYGAALRVRSTWLQKMAAHAGTDFSSARGDEVSEEVVVYGESDPADGGEGGGGTDVLTLDMDMFMIVIKIVVPQGPLPGPTGGGGDDTPDECDLMRSALNGLKASQAADQTAVKVLKELIADATTQEERQTLKAELKATRDALADTKDKIKEQEARMADADC